MRAYEGVRDLAGSFMMSAMQLTSSVELGKQQGADVSTAVDAGVLAVNEVLKHWITKETSAEQQKAMGDALSSMFRAIGGASPGEPTIQGYIVNLRKSVEGISDHRKFCVEMMKAYEKLTNKPFVYFNGVESNPEWQVVQLSERAALGTLGDGTVLSHTITLQQVNGTWRISSLCNERQLSEDAQPKEPAPSTAAAEMLQRLQGSWDVASLNFAAGEPRDLVVRDQLLLLPGTLLGKPIVTSMKLEWPNPNRPDEVDIIWDPINTH